MSKSEMDDSTGDVLKRLATWPSQALVQLMMAGEAQGVQLGGIAAVGLENQNAAWLALTERFYTKRPSITQAEFDKAMKQVWTKEKSK